MEEKIKNWLIVMLILVIIVLGVFQIFYSKEAKEDLGKENLMIKYGLCRKECAGSYSSVSEARENCMLNCLDVYNINSDEYLEWRSNNPKYNEFLSEKPFTSKISQNCFLYENDIEKKVKGMGGTLSTETLGEVFYSPIYDSCLYSWEQFINIDRLHSDFPDAYYFFIDDYLTNETVFEIEEHYETDLPQARLRIEVEIKKLKKEEPKI